MSNQVRTAPIFEALASPYRRQLLFALMRANPQGDEDLDPMALIAGGEVDDLAVTQEELFHVHLPKLADMEFIEWDREAGQIKKGPRWEEIAPLIKLMRDHRDELPEGWLSGMGME